MIKILEDMHLGIIIKWDLAFAIVYHSSNSPYKKFESEQFIELLSDFINIFNEIEINSIKNRKYIQNTEFVLEKLQNFLFPHNIEIRLTGTMFSGISTIKNLWPGLSIIGKEIFDYWHIPYKKKLNGKSVIFKEYFRYERIAPLSRYAQETHLFFIIDSSKEEEMNSSSLLKHIHDENPTMKILVIANKQDLPDAIPPEEIEEIMGYPTVGFSAIVPDAPERLEQILIDFLKD